MCACVWAMQKKGKMNRFQCEQHQTNQVLFVLLFISLTHFAFVRKKNRKMKMKKDESQNECNSHWIFKLAIKHSDRTHTNKRRQFLYISFPNGVGILKMKLLLSQTMWRDTHVRNNVKWNEWCLINYYFVTESENDSLSKNTSLWLYPSYGIGL